MIQNRDILEKLKEETSGDKELYDFIELLLEKKSDGGYTSRVIETELNRIVGDGKGDF